MLTLEKFSVGVGDRFAHQAKAQLQACVMAAARGVTVIPVWNKSNREHGIVGSEPASVRAAADAAVRQSGWKQPYHVDADHINLGTVDRFIDASDFYTLDVAAAIGQPAAADRVDAFVERHPELHGNREHPRHRQPFTITRDAIAQIACKYLAAVQQAGAIYRHVDAEARRPRASSPRSRWTRPMPRRRRPELLRHPGRRLPTRGFRSRPSPPSSPAASTRASITSAMSVQFEKEFSDDLAVIAFAVRQYGLPANLKLSVHSGSDKFSHLRPHPARAPRSSAPASTSRPRAPPGWKS